MLYMLDTNTCDYIIWKQPPSAEEILTDKIREGHDVCMSIITYRELRNNIRNKGAAEREELYSHIDGLRDRLSFRPIEWDNACERRFVALKRAFIGQFPEARIDRIKNDLMIAAQALVRSATVVTNDKRDFPRIERAGGPPWENWVR